MRKLRFENISPAVNTSLKVHAYNQKQQCYGVGWHIHPEYEVVYIRNGAGLINVDTKSIPYQDGVLLFLGPDIPHTDFGNTDHKNGLEIVVQFSEAFLKDRLFRMPELASLRQLTERSRKVLIFNPQLAKEIGPYFEGLPQQPPAERLLTFIACLLRMQAPGVATEVFPGLAQPTVAKPMDAKRLEMVFSRINRDFGHQLTSSDLAGELGMTTNSFCRFFKANTQKTFLQFLNNYRLERAMDLLQNTDDSIQEIMYSCGFRDGPYFSRAFRQLTQQSPSAFRAAKPERSL